MGSIPVSTTVRVGVVGANVERGWFSVAHAPALRVLPAIEVAAVATTRPDSARAAAESFGAQHWFTDPVSLARCDDVDVVLVTIKVPGHGAAVRPAIEADKHVFCEWPLARNVGEAQELARLAAAGDVRTAVGLQGRMSPIVEAARALIDKGLIGTVLGCHALVCSSIGAAPHSPTDEYLFALENGAHVLTIHGGHLLDVVCALVGEPEAMRRRVDTRIRDVKIAGCRSVPNTSPDSFVLHGTLGGGASLDVIGVAGRRHGINASIEVVGTDGVVVLDAGGSESIQIAPLSLRWRSDSRADWVEELLEEVDDSGFAQLRGPAQNVARLLHAFFTDIRTGSTVAPDFELAARRHALLSGA